MVRDALDLAAASVKAVTTSRGLFILRSVGEIGLVMAEVMAPVVLAFRFGSIAGWSGAEVALLIGLSRSGQGFAYLLGRGLDPANFAQTVREGRFDQVLVRPVSPVVWMMTSDIQLRYLFRGLTGVGIVVVAGNRAGLPWTGPNIALLVLAATACGTMLLAINVLGASLTLITSEGSEITNLLGDGGLGLISFPLDLYGSPLRFVFTFVIPVGLCVYVPLLVVLGRDGPGFLGSGLLWALPGVLGGFVAASSLAWRLALTHYRSTGS